MPGGRLRRPASRSITWTYTIARGRAPRSPRSACLLRLRRAQGFPRRGRVGDHLAFLVEQLRAQRGDAPAVPQETRATDEASGARHRQILDLHLQRGARSAAPVEQMTHRDVEHEGDHPAVQAALRVQHEILHLEADPAFLVGVLDLHAIELYEKKLAEVLPVGGERLLEGLARDRFVYFMHPSPLENPQRRKASANHFAVTRFFMDER